MSNIRQGSLQKCMYVNEETPHRDPSTIFHSPFSKGTKSGNFNNPSYMSSEVFYPHQQNNLNQVNYSRTPKRDSVSGDNNNSKSPIRPQGNSSASQVNQNKSSTKYSYINDYQKFLDANDKQSDTKSQASYISNSYNKNNQSQNSTAIINQNKSYHVGNKSVSNAADIGLPPQHSATPKNSKNMQQLRNIFNQDTTASSNKNRSHSQFDLGDLKKQINLDNTKTINGKESNGYLTPNDNQQQSASNQKYSQKPPSPLLKLEMVKNNQKLISESTKNAYTPNSTQERIFNAPVYRASTPKNGNSNINSQSHTPKSQSRNGSQVFQFPNSQQQLANQQQQNQNQYQQQQQESGQKYNNNQNDQISLSSQKSNNSKGNSNFKLIKSPQNVVKNGQTTHQHHYNNLSKSPTPKSGTKVSDFYNPQEVGQQQNHIRNNSTTPKRAIDLVSNLSTKGSNSNQMNEKQQKLEDDGRSVTSTSSCISQLVCNNCINKDLIVDKQLRQQQEKERQANLERQALEAEKNNQYNQYMYQQEQSQNAKNRFVKDVQEQVEYKNQIKRDEHEREKHQRRVEQEQFKEEQDRVYRQKLDDLKNYREQYKKDIETQILSKQERQQKEKQVDQQILNNYAVMKEQDMHDYINLIASKQNQTQKIRDDLLNQINEKKMLNQLKSQENIKYKQQMDKQLLHDMEIKERQLQERAEELKQFKDFWNQQQQIKEKQKMDKQRENEVIKQMQETQQEHDRSNYIHNLEKNEYIKKVTAEQLKNQIETKKDQQLREVEEKLKYGKQLKEQQERELQIARANFHDCDRCHNVYPSTHLTKQKQHKSKPSFKV